MNLIDAERLAAEVVSWLEPACLKVVVAGSVRRRKPEVGDLEIVAVSKPLKLVFSEPPRTPLESALGKLIAARTLIYDIEVKRDGDKYKRFRLPGHGIALDLFIVQADNFGNQLIIRTGDSAFSRLCMSRRRYGGLMPSELHHEGGYLRRGTERVPCPTEREFFAALGLDEVPEPEARTETTARRLAAERRRAG